MVALSKKQSPKLSKDEIELAISSSNSLSELARKLKGSDSYGVIRTLRRYFNYYGISPKFTKKKQLLAVKPKYSHDEMFREDSPVPTSILVKFFRRYYPPKECSECGIGTIWNGKPLTLHIDHLNGRGTDWRVENCRYLCPNCHYQTDTHGTKRGVKRLFEIAVTPKELSESYDELKSFVAVGEKYGISDRTVKNVVRKFKKLSNLE
jgi:5-methylcytosine-specific restriction endonuclease McrA